MKGQIVLAAINAKYIHTNLAVRSIAACCRQEGIETQLLETTINNRERQILEELYRADGDIYVFSCYIWNIELVCRLAADLRRIRPDAVLIGAGPQVSYHRRAFMQANPAFDYLLYGEGERSTPALLRAILAGEAVSRCKGVCYRRDGILAITEPPAPMAMDDLPFAYADLEALDGRILYYESMRGCPFACAYCLSSLDKGVRVRSIERVQADLDRFLERRVKQVKLVDRTFNAVKSHAMAVWEYLIRHDNSVTNFHFELSGELLDDDMLDLLQTARPGLFQFEIGVQSANEETLRAIHRPFSFDRLAQAVERLRQAGGIHLHLDLIAGLPHENFASLADSFNRVFALEPDQLQLGFLKVLPGSELETKAAEYGIVYSRTAPFEVLGTSWLDFGELCRLHGIADMVELYHNSGRFRHSMEYIRAHFDNPFACFAALWEYYLEQGYNQRPLSKIGYYDLLKPFMECHGIPVTERVQWLCKLDVVAVEKPRRLPQWVEVDASAEYYDAILELLGNDRAVRRYLPSYAGMEPKHIRRIAHVEILPFSPKTGENTPTAAVFDYEAGTRAYLPVDRESGKILAEAD
ncbi:B12-binding domain-containing radical SAM protein [Ruminococcaceae bacterium OttesenSCG-928-L11]|nr:B12-binding domain-containing radical SAM protein [Ruminococcaceae bacterium OttesenSCG-928-L11]